MGDLYPHESLEYDNFTWVTLALGTVDCIPHTYFKFP